MSRSSFLPIITQSPVFQGVSLPTHQRILSFAQIVEADQQGFLIRQGYPATTLYILVHGHARLLHLAHDGSQVLVRFVGPGQEFGVIALLSGFEYPVSVQAVEACVTLAWQGELLAQLVEEYPLIGFNALRAMALQNQELLDRYQELLTEHVAQRLAQALSRLTEQMGHTTPDGTLVDCPISREDLAEYVGTTLPTVSRILSQWERCGVVVAKWKSVLILRPQDLERLATQPQP